ncbi:MAG: SUMF1/EgtB/PvdO family nonheme iron enzyme [Candidatus Magnetomorum sp.]|nr:SUMF1/EgtB/PvdO family nonheme iron enzyme [Candidatus Magnetomorum sp.]
MLIYHGQIRIRCSNRSLIQGHVHKGSNRVVRGGNWGNNAQNCRSAQRNNNSPGNRNNNYGCRLLST